MVDFSEEYDYPKKKATSSKPVLVWDPNNPARFTDLIDTFSDYAGHGGKFIMVKQTEDGLTVSVVTVESDKHSAHVQSTPSTDFTITHDLEKFPTFDAWNTAGDPARLHWVHVDNRNIRVRSIIPFDGTIYMN